MTATIPVFCLMGPTASGKTPLAIELAQRLPCEIISVDSAMVYRGMDIGTSKPDAETQKYAPHRLIDIRDPAQIYSAGQFRDDALSAINDIIGKGKIPLLVGGTMLYFRVLQQGLANLPVADPDIRASLLARAQQEGWDALHAELGKVDPEAAKRIHSNDSQRIQRALEVYLLTSRPISVWQAEQTNPLSGYRVHQLAIAPSDRALLHERIALRFAQMLTEGLIDEVQSLHARNDLTMELPSIRSVGYCEVWGYLENQWTYDEMQNKAIAATRQLAKRQLTWLRSWPDVTWFASEQHNLFANVTHWMSDLI